MRHPTSPQMRSRRSFVVLLVCALLGGMLVSRGPTAQGQAQDDVLAVIVNPAVPVRSLNAYELEAIFTLAQREWSGGGHIVPFNHMPGSLGREHFDRVVLHMNPEQVGRFWIDKRVRGGGFPPRVVSVSSIVGRVVASLAGSIGYVRRSEVTKDVKVVAWIDGNRVLPP